ncbi:MAG: acyloxyacyl hydrolase [Sphingobacteriales bacterium]|nr:acyloxyacyl hydrolase [Sphingobacteriales bacterium]
MKTMNRMKTRAPYIVLFALAMAIAYTVPAQEFRGQYPPALRNSYFGVNIGYIQYPFSTRQLQPGNTVGSVKVPHTAVRIVLLGHEFNKNLSAQITYMRPVKWVEYRDVNNTGKTMTVWMNVAGLTVAGKIPLAKKFTLFTEAGLALVMRRGFTMDNQPVVKSASYGTGLFGASLQYKLNPKWDLQLSTTYSPENKKELQPHTLFYSAGFHYFMRELPKERVEKVKAAGYHFPRQTLSLGYATNAMGYGVNKFVSQGVIPIFWGGEVKVKHGLLINYQHNLFHSRKVFSLDWGIEAAFWKTNLDQTRFFTVSAYPVMRFHTIRSKSLDFYLEYSVAGPSFISKPRMDGLATGQKFTFKDMMGLGVFAGKKKNINAGIRIAHYSNGNLFPENDGVMVPLTFSMGYAF